MARSVKSQGKARFAPAALAVAGLALAIPATGLAVVQTSAAAELPETVAFLPFTPAKVDPQLAARVAAVMGEDGLRFTPASKPLLKQDRTVTVAVRVDDETARAISVRNAIDSVGTAESRERVLAVSSTSYNLGVARGYQSFATAASMNGYTSAIAAVLSRGVKRTLPAQQPEAVFADIDVISSAPAYLNRAGFGDLLSKPYSNADWLLSHYVRGVPYDARPGKLLDEAYDALLQCATAVGRGEADGIGTLTRTILLSGFTMAIAGTSAPASGGEHLVSHYWDMEQHCRNEALFGLHGTQVGIATRQSALLFERLVALEASDIDVDAAVARRGDASWLDGLAELHPRLTPAVIEEVRAQITAKQKHSEALREELTTVRDRWEEIRAGVKASLVPSERISKALVEAGAADRPSAIKVDREHAVHTQRVCRQIRSRYVALDLMDDLGKLDAWAAEVVDAVESCGN